MPRFPLFFLCIIALPAFVSAATVNVPGEFSNIQAGVDAVDSGDTVLVAAGVYSGNGNQEIDFFGEDIVVIAVDGPGATVIEGDLIFRAFRFRNGETQSARVEGFTMTNCSGQVGGAITCEGSSPTIYNCRFIENVAVSWGGAVYSDANARVIDCLVSGNSAERGGGLYGDLIVENTTVIGNTCAFNGGGMRGAGTVTNSVFIGNSAEDGGGLFGDFVVKDCTIVANEASNWGGGIVAEDLEVSSIEGCLIAGNRGNLGGGVYVDFLTDADLTSNTIAGNYAESFGGGIYIGSPDEVSIEKTIIWGNCAATDGDEIYGASTNSIPFICNAVDSSGIAQPELFDVIGDQVYTDPMFCDPLSCDLAPSDAGDYTLFADSPCLPGSSPCGELIGALPIGCPASSAPEEGGARVSGLLGVPYPNPAGGSIQYGVTLTTDENVLVRVFDVRGQLVGTLLDTRLSPGSHTFNWNPQSDRGAKLAGGVYFMQLDAGAVKETRKLNLSD
jgi:hypothetical protein